MAGESYDVLNEERSGSIPLEAVWEFWGRCVALTGNFFALKSRCRYNLEPVRKEKDTGYFKVRSTDLEGRMTSLKSEKL